MSYVVPKYWYLDRPGERAGPLSVSELYRLLETGEVGPQDLVHAEGSTEWVPIGEVIRQAGESVAASAASAAKSPFRPAQRAPNYITRHWRGDLSLGVSYWVNLFLLTLVIQAAFRLSAEMKFLGGLSYHQAAIALTAMVGASLIIGLWQLVGTWRSSDKHTARGGRKGWATAAKVVMVLAVIRSGIDFSQSVIPTVVNAWRHAGVMASLPSAAISPLRGGTEIEFIGGIHTGTSERFRAVLAQYPEARVIHLDSIGGELAESHAMATMIRARGMDTYVRGTCLSACTLVFLAGRNRLLKDGARLGFHAPAAVAGGVEGAQVIDGERRRLLLAGVPDWFVAKVFAARNDDMWFPTLDELRTAGVITGTTDGRHLSPGLPTPQLTDTDALRFLRGMSLAAAMERADPVAFREMVSGIRAALNDGGTEADVALVVEQQVAPIYNRSLPVLPDRQVISIVRIMMDVARRLGASDARVCRNWLMHRPGQPIPIIGPHITAQQQQALVQMMADALATAADPTQRTAAPLQEPPQLLQVFSRLESRLSPTQLAVFDNPDSSAHAPAAVCSAFIEMFSEIIRLPEREAGALLRYLFAGT